MSNAPNYVGPCLALLLTGAAARAQAPSDYTLLGDTRTTADVPDMSPSLVQSEVNAQNPPDPSEGEDVEH